MKTGTALVLCFVIWFGWARYAEYQTAQQRKADAQQAEAVKRLNDYDACVNPDSRHTLAELNQAEQDCRGIIQ